MTKNQCHGIGPMGKDNGPGGNKSPEQARLDAFNGHKPRVDTKECGPGFNFWTKWSNRGTSIRGR